MVTLWKQLQEVQVIHVRGTPTSGKSTLAHLLHAYVKRVHADWTVYEFSWPTKFVGDLTHVSSYGNLLNQRLGKPASYDWMTQTQTLLIIDEAQLSYEYDSLWIDFIKRLASDRAVYGPLVILFTSYGSPSEVPFDTPIGTTPVHFYEGQRISIRPLSHKNLLSLYFTREEFDNVVGRVCKDVSKDDQPFSISTELAQYIWDITSGHPGGTRAILGSLAHTKELRQHRKTGKIISLSDGVALLEDDSFVLENLVSGPQAFKRSLFRRHHLQNDPSLVKILREVLIYGFSRESPASNKALNECYRRGWLHAALLPDEITVYVYPTRVHHRCAELLLRMNIPKFPLDKYPTVRDLSFAAIRHFSVISLRSSLKRLGPAAESRPLEAQFQDEFYRACYLLLDRFVYLTPEWTGRAYFQIKSVGWAIECLRDGDRLDEHVARFLPNGKYHSWIASDQVKDYILLDFRRTMPIKPRSTNLIFILYFKPAN